MEANAAPDSHGANLESPVPPSLEPVDGVFTKDVTIDPENKVWARIYTPIPPDSSEDGGKTGDPTTKGVRQMPIILFYHGGGFVRSSADSLGQQPLCRSIARGCQALLISTNYRKAPEFPCPAAYDDSFKTLEWLRSPESKACLPTGADVSQCFLVGCSAGGNIAHFMGCRAAAAREDISPVQIQGIVELQPFFGGEDITPAEAADRKSSTLTPELCHDAWAKFVPGHNRDHPCINVFGPNSSDISRLGLPPILVITGSRDVLIDRQVSYVQKLQSMGKDVTMLNYDQADHVFYSREAADHGNQKQEALENVCRFIRAHAVKE